MRKLIILLLLLVAPSFAFAAAVDVKISHFPGGISTATEGDQLFDYPYPDETEVYKYFNDYMVEFVAADWTITTTESGTVSAIEAVRTAASYGTAVAGGVLQVINDNTTGDKDSLQLVGNPFLLVSGKRAWMSARFSVSSGGSTTNNAATFSDFMIGLVGTDTTPFTHTDGLVFKKESGDAQIDFSSLKDSAGTTASNIGTLVADTMIELGMYFDGKDMGLYVNGNRVSVKTDASFSDNEYLRPTFYIANGPGVGGVGHKRAINIDYFLSAVER